MAPWGEDARESDDRARGAAAEDERELALEDDDRLPWLESDEDEPLPGFDTGRLVGLGLIMLVVLAALVGGVWFLTHRGLSNEPPADGSLIAAPEGPYKVRPSDAGGKTFAGTGDTSFAVGEGKTVDARLGISQPDPAASAIARETGQPAPEPSATKTAPPSAGDGGALRAGTAVQVGAYSSRADAQDGWRTLTRQTATLAGVSYRIVEGQADIGKVFRLQAVGGDHAGAVALCDRLRSDGVACQVK